MADAQAIVAKISNPRQAAPQAEGETVDNVSQVAGEGANNDTNPAIDKTIEGSEGKEDQNLSARFAALSRREKLLVEKERTLKEQISKIKQFEDEKSAAKNNPLDFIEKSGLSLDEVLEAALGTKREPTLDDKIKKLQDQIEAQNQRAEEEKKKAQEEQERLKKENEEKLISNFKASIVKHVDDNADKYELIKENGAYETVYEVIEQYYAETAKTGKPVMLELDKASEYVENYLFEQAQALIKKSKKLGGLLNTSVEAKKSSEGQASSSPSVTLSNAIANGSSVAVDEMKGLSREERLKRSASLLKWT